MPSSHPPRRGALLPAVCLAVLAVVLGGCAGGTQPTSAPAPTSTSATSATSATVSSPAPTTAPTTVATTAVPEQRPEQRSAPKPANHCAHNTARQLVLVSLRAQHAWFCERAHAVFDTPVTSGMSGQYTQTPTGRYHVQGRDRHATLTLNTGRQYQVQYWIPFDAPLYGFHDSPWQHFPYGSQQYRTRGSHGCIHLPLTAMKHLYEWAHVGASVTIRR